MNSLREYALSLGKEIKWHSDHEPIREPLVLKAGCLSMIYENGCLRYLSVADHEVLRMIYPAVRDKKWMTIDPVISDEEFDIHKDWFTIKYNCQYKSDEISFSAQYTIEGNKDNSLIFTMEGEAMRTFEKNRIGFCVLHPVDNCAGEKCIIVHTNGEYETKIFPRLVSPDNLFSDVRSMKWSISEYPCVLNFYGDVFETEDQRNWTDASFKTYCTPLNLPFPEKLEKGSRISQRIEFKVEVEVEAEVEAEDKKKDSGPVVITAFPEKTINLPDIGVGRSTRQLPLTNSEIETLRKIRFDHYRIDLYLFNSDWKTDAEAAAAEAEQLGYKLEFALFLDDHFEFQLTQFIFWIRNKKPVTSLISLFHKSYPATPGSIINKIYTILNYALPDIKIGFGTNANFAQLNRNRPESDHLFYFCYSIHPQEHASDNTTLVENLKAQGNTVESATEFAAGRGVWVSPVNIQRRFNANIENYESIIKGDEFPPQVDSRLMSLFGACWTIGSIKYLIESGIKGATFFETVGERGIFQGDYPSRWPERFQSAKGMIFPVFHVFKYILNNKSSRVINTESSKPLKVESLLISDGNKIKLILANSTSVEQHVIIKGILWNYKFIIKQLDAESFAAAACDSTWIETAPQSSTHPNAPILLKPFSVNFIERVF